MWSNINGPNGKIAAIKPRINILIDHFCFSHTTNNTTRKAINSRPCPMPTYFTRIGFPIMYFIGIAIKSKSKKEIPSMKPTTRKVLIFMVTIFKMRMNRQCSA